jgi:hypothetical protein
MISKNNFIIKNMFIHITSALIRKVLGCWGAVRLFMVGTVSSNLKGRFYH